MSDKETAPWIKKTAETIQRKYNPFSGGIRQLTEIIAETFAVECTAPAPQRPNCDYTGAPSLDSSQLCRCGTCQLYARVLFNWLATLDAATPQVTPQPTEEVSREPHDGWMNEWLFKNIPKDQNCGYLWNENVRKLAGDWADFRLQFEGTSEQASPTPEKCPSCSSEAKSIERWPCAKRYGGTADSWHSSAATQKGSK